MGAVLKVLLRCLLRMLTPYIDFQGLVSTRTPSSFNFSSPKGEGFYFCPALNMSLEAYVPFCMLFLYKAPLRGIFFCKTSSNYFCVSNTSQKYCRWTLLIPQNTLYAQCVHLLCVLWHMTECQSHVPAIGSLYRQILSRFFFRSEKRW